MTDAANLGASGENAAAAKQFSLRQRLLLFLITTVGSLAIRAIGWTLRCAVSFEEGGPTSLDDRPLVISLWHVAHLPYDSLSEGRNARQSTSHSINLIFQASA